MQWRMKMALVSEAYAGALSVGDALDTADVDQRTQVELIAAREDCVDSVLAGDVLYFATREVKFRSNHLCIG